LVRALGDIPHHWRKQEPFSSYASAVSAEPRDRWAEWLAERRFGGDQATRELFLSKLAATRDAVLDRAQLRAGEDLLDVGCGEGLIAFGALERGARTVTFSDISSELLEFCRKAATDIGVLDRCRFVEAPAEDLDSIGDETVDVVTTRSVLIYVKDKAAALAGFERVLRPGGRISLFEPINRFSRDSEQANRFAGYDLSGLDEVAAKVRSVFEAIQPPDSDPMLDFDERDLLRLIEEAGFSPISMMLDVTVEPAPPRNWDGFFNSSGNPTIPTVAQAINQALTSAERDALIERLRPLVEQGLGEWRMATAYLTATKPAGIGS
jgi:arsenite methyltransferase